MSYIALKLKDMEFKGTKGKWVLREYQNDFSIVSESDKWLICQSDTKEKKDKYNALLISKAPEMLEMLHKAKLELSRIKGSMMAHPDCVQGSEFDDYTDSAEEVENEIENLIKQATEL